MTHFEKLVPKDLSGAIKTYVDDINNQDLVSSLLQDNNIRQVYHLAVESHVDRSISGPLAFYESNVMGTLSMVEANATIEQKGIDDFRFLHVSTDEVFGDLRPGGPTLFRRVHLPTEFTLFASKAASDLIITSWHRTFGFPGMITNCSNNFGLDRMPRS